MTQQPAGWYSNPENPDEIRWWDGSHWSERVKNIPAPTMPHGASMPSQSVPPVSVNQTQGRSVHGISGWGFGLGLAAFFLFGFPVLGPLICIAAIVVSTTALIRRQPGASRNDKVLAIIGLVLGVVYTLMALIWAVTGRM